jgi:hypothetical protein
MRFGHENVTLRTLFSGAGGASVGAMVGASVGGGACVAGAAVAGTGVAVGPQAVSMKLAISTRLTRNISFFILLFLLRIVIE